MVNKYDGFIDDINNEVGKLVEYIDYKYGFDGEHTLEERKKQIKNVLLSSLTEYVSLLKEDW